MQSSGRIGDGTNIIIYEHNKDQILGPIRWAKEGEKFELTDNQGKKYVYITQKVAMVDPSNLEYIQPTNEERLTLYTCTGFLDNKRLIVIVKLENIVEN